MKTCTCKYSQPFKEGLVIFKTKMKGRGKGQVPKEYAVSKQLPVCGTCDGFIYGKEQEEEALHLANQARRKELGFLTGDEIKALREKLGLTRRLFAKYLKLSTRSIELWEITNKPYEASNDELIRIKCSDSFVSMHREEIEALKKNRV